MRYILAKAMDKAIDEFEEQGRITDANRRTRNVERELSLTTKRYGSNDKYNKSYSVGNR